MPKRTPDSGQALPLALVSLAIGVVLVSVFIAAVGTYLRLIGEDASALLRYYAADAGIERAIAPLVTNPNAYTNDTTFSDLTISDYTPVIHIRPLGSHVVSEPGPGGPVTTTVTSYLVTSTADALSVTARVEARQRSGASTATLRIRAWRVGR